MGRIIHLIRIEGQCHRCHRTVDGYGQSPADATNRLCPYCRQPLVLHAGRMTPAWELEDGSCLLLRSEPLQPPDVALYRQREAAIVKFGRGFATSFGIGSIARPYGLVCLRTAVANCFSCHEQTLVSYLTDWQRRRLVCRMCSSDLHLGHEREILAAPEGDRFWPLAADTLELTYPFHRDQVSLGDSGVVTFTDLDLELLGLK